MEFSEIDINKREEIERVVSIEEEAFGNNGGVDEWVLKPLAKYGKVFVLKDKGNIVCVAEFMQKFGENSVYLYGICTEKNKRGKGLAKHLLEKSLEYFSSYGIESIDLTVSPENGAAVELYEKLGFEKKKILKNEYGIGVDRLYMVREIDAKNRGKVIL